MCHCLRIGPRFNVTCGLLNIQGADVHWTESTKFLGVTLCRSKTFKCIWDDAKSKFYCSSNAIIGKLGTAAAANVLLKLIYAQGVANLLYGISATTLSESEFKSFSYAYNSMYAKIFSTHDNNVISCCQYFSGYLCFPLLYELHRYLFLVKLLNTNRINNYSQIDQCDYKDYIRLSSKYNFTPNDSLCVIKRKMWTLFKDIVCI